MHKIPRVEPYKVVNDMNENIFKPSSTFLTDRSNAVLLLWILFVICVSCHTVLYVPCCLVVTYWERADLLYVMFLVFSSLSHMVYWVRCGILIVWFPDLCLLPYYGLVLCLQRS